MFVNKVIEENDKTKEFYNIVKNFIQTDFQPLENVNIVFSLVSPTRFAYQTALPLKVFKLSPNIRDLFKKDFHIEISQDMWKASSKAEKLILIWRGLRICHVDVDENNKIEIDGAGRVMIGINKPDIECGFFSDEILKFGSSGSFKAVAKTLNYLLSKER